MNKTVSNIVMRRQLETQIKKLGDEIKFIESEIQSSETILQKKQLSWHAEQDFNNDIKSGRLTIERHLQELEDLQAKLDAMGGSLKPGLDAGFKHDVVKMRKKIKSADNEIFGHVMANQELREQIDKNKEEIQHLTFDIGPDETDWSVIHDNEFENADYRMEIHKSQNAIERIKKGRAKLIHKTLHSNQFIKPPKIK